MTKTKPIILDFGRYTQWARPDNPPGPIDAVIYGATSGNYFTQTYEANKDHIKAERRKMLYHFYEPYYSAIHQANRASEAIDYIKPQMNWIDFEEYRGLTFGKEDVTRVGSIVDVLEGRYGVGYVGIYANISDLYTIAIYKPELVARIPLWIAYPPPPDSANYLRTDYDDWPTWGDKLRALPGFDREWSTVELLQFDWWASAQDYGALNEKKSMDRSVFLQGDLNDLDIWLGLEPESEEQVVDILELQLETLARIEAENKSNHAIIISNQAEMKAMLKDIEQNLADHHLDVVSLLGSGAVAGENSGSTGGNKSKQWQFKRSTGSRSTKIFKLVDKGNGKVGPAEEFGENQTYDIVWRVSDGDIVEELSIADDWPGYDLASNTSPASSWKDLKYVKLTNTGSDGVERSKKGLIVRGFNDGKFINVGSGKTW